MNETDFYPGNLLFIQYSIIKQLDNVYNVVLLIFYKILIISIQSNTKITSFQNTQFCKNWKSYHGRVLEILIFMYKNFKNNIKHKLCSLLKCFLLVLLNLRNELQSQKVSKTNYCLIFVNAFFLEIYAVFSHQLHRAHYH